VDVVPHLLTVAISLSPGSCGSNCQPRKIANQGESRRLVLRRADVAVSGRRL
jgi:hypothetical protein